jgi:tetratricopeptide (TPR) repeat protein
MLHESREEDDLAHALLLETCDIQRKLLERKPGVPQLQADLARSLQNLAMVRQVLGRHGEAEAGLLEAVELLEPVVAGAASVPQYQRDLAAVHEALGWLLTELRRLDEAERSFGRALELADRLCLDFPQDVHHPRLRGRILAGYALHLVASGRDDAALETADEALAALEPLLQANPEGIDLRRSTVNALTARARAAARTGDPGGAIADLERAAGMNPSEPGAGEERALAPAWVALWSGDASGAADEVARIEAGKEPSLDQRFAFARLLALAAGAAASDEARTAELAALALRQLQVLAAADGLTQRRRVRLQRDADFEALRSRPELQTLLSTGR